jgi:hypothetical protein
MAKDKEGQARQATSPGWSRASEESKRRRPSCRRRPRAAQYYREKVVPELMQKFGYKT